MASLNVGGLRSQLSILKLCDLISDNDINCFLCKTKYECYLKHKTKFCKISGDIAIIRFSQFVVPTQNVSSGIKY